MSQQDDKKLFQKKTLKNYIGNFIFPQDIEVKHEIIKKWVEALESGTLDKMKETSLHGDFLKDVFQDVLGYKSVIAGSGQVWEICAEKSIADGGGVADAALGLFTATQNIRGGVKLQGRIVAPIELKGTKEDLDRPAPGRKESAVDQGWRYANYTPDCQWIIVSNYRELRLYHTNKTPAYFERFILTDLVDLQEFKKFYFVLCRQNFLLQQNKPEAISIIDRLLVASNEAQEEITKQLYEEYKQVRLNIVKHFRYFFGNLDITNCEQVLIEKAQKALDRILFIAFCESRDLLPKRTISNAHDAKDIYNPHPIWDNYKAVFRWVDEGNEDPPIPGYNGGLFQHDQLLDEQLTIPDGLCTDLKKLTRFDFESEVSVDILGHIFEQSITDIEELKANITKQDFDKQQGKRKKLGVYYTPAYITKYIVEVSIGGYLLKREEELRKRFQLDESVDNSTSEYQAREVQFWKAYRDEVLLKTRVIDPACGSGAFLIAAFDYLMLEYKRVNDYLHGLNSHPQENLEVDRTILVNNLFGVDLSPESVEITKLSLWLKTAVKGKTLTYLDDNIKVGNSIVDDGEYTNLAFVWSNEFPQVFADGGFDVVIGNPPYVRQELLSGIKPYLKENYQAYDGVADIYVYFYEKGLKLLKSGGILSYIVTNKWLKSGYGEPLRRFFSEESVFEQIIDFGHAPIFEDADTFPCIVAARKVEGLQVEKEEESVLVCAVPREELKNINLTQYVRKNENSFNVPWSRFGAEAWSLEPPAVDELMQKIKNVGVPLKDFAGVKPIYGIKTGFNEAFLIDEATKNKLVQADPKCAEIIKPLLRGQDIKRWIPNWDNLWIIFAHREINIENYPIIEAHLEQYRDKLEARAGKQLWWQWQASPLFYHLFEKPKLIYQEIQFHPAYSFDTEGYFTNNKAFILPNSDLYILGVLNSPLIWWHNWRYLPHMKDEALTPVGELMEVLPIAQPTEEIRAEVEEIVSRLIEIAKINGEANKDFFDWLQVNYKIDKLGQKLENFTDLEFKDFADEVRKRMKSKSSKASDPLSPQAFKALREAFNDFVPPIQSRNAEILRLEYRLSDLVNQAYNLTPEEVDLMWRTAPPRMPFSKPNGTI